MFKNDVGSVLVVAPEVLQVSMYSLESASRGHNSETWPEERKVCGDWTTEHRRGQNSGTDRGYGRRHCWRWK